ncbi:luciferase family oxidoreductase, group 1 [Pelagirhabdus alkalitolerans]|uniref:Luciferase family oxidoreductase, group 1 n=1 Tax=Pelagirhabdus alkalitolerans TaxID=1612202 RepID=A0A1G6H7W1_9BACI|nr:LLM class flavin-dependent oxidoreductase [Pelagirhabdus alkalitolerans]SDB89536.1 luciferase family oxidoreductase, group 1 [Pelagirhabdus alkalitolerans]
MTKLNIPVSVLNLAPVRQGQTNQDAIQSMVDLAKATEQLGYKRYWIAEHHNAPTLMSSATSVLIKHVLDKTDSIRVGAGGIMLPNHVPLVVAEQFGTMETIHPDRVDLGLGRAPGTDMMTARALRRAYHQDPTYQFSDDVNELLMYFDDPSNQGQVMAHPGAGTYVPAYILGSSTDSAKLAAKLGLPYAFAAHFAPDHLKEAIRIYREQFRPSNYLSEPYMIVCVNVIASDTDEDARRELTTTQQFFLNIIRNTKKPLSPPVDNMDDIWTPFEKHTASSMTSYTFIGSPETIKQQWIDFQNELNVDEVMAVSYIYDQAKQEKSYQLFKDVIESC